MELPSDPLLRTVADEDRAAGELALPTDVGPELGRYLVIAQIGTGGMGRVFRAYDPKLGREVALKRLHLGAASDGTDVARMLREAKAMAALAHPNVVPVYDVDVDRGALFIAMEFVAGATLRTWMNRGTHGWREIVDVFVQAGRGLAAAHAQGIVHRDFKPSNVVVGGDGRARVMDFGLARAADDGPGALEPVPDGLAAAAFGEALDVETALVTADGTVVGTPAYMAPEQHLAQRVDARSDQYAFCCALWEALHHRLPFSARDLGELAAAKHRGPPAPPSRSGVPSAVQAIVARGLAPDPEQRWPDLPRLLEALERASRSRRWLAPAAVGVAVAAALVVLAFRADDACTRGEQALAAAWSPALEGELAQAIRGSGAAYAETTLARVTTALHTYAASWSAMHHEVCTAGDRRDDVSAEAFDLRMACLAARRVELGDATAILRAGDPEVVEHAIELVGGLAPLAHCADVVALRQRSAPPREGEDGERSESVRAALARARLEHRAGRHELALGLAQQAYRDALATEDPVVVAEAEVELGADLSTMGRHDEAMPLLERAYEAALVHRRGHTAAHAGLELTLALGDHVEDAEDELWISRAAMGLAIGDGTDPQLVAMTTIAYGQALADLGRRDEAAPVFERALGELEAAVGPEHPGLVPVLLNYTNILHELGRIAESERICTRAAEIAEAAYGSDHPHIGVALTHIGFAQLRDRRFDDALASFDRARTIALAAYGPMHEDVWRAYGLRAAVLAEQGHFDEAAASIEQSLASMGDRVPELHTARAGTLQNLALMDALRGDHERSLEHVRRAVALRRGLGNTIDLAQALTHEGEQLVVLDRLDEAEAVLAEAAALEEAGGVAGGSEGQTKLVRAKLARRRGDDVRARELVEAALRELPAARDPSAWADAEFLLAQILFEHGDDRRRAVALVEAALGRLEAKPRPADRAAIAAMEAWLDRNAPPAPETMLGPGAP